MLIERRIDGAIGPHDEVGAEHLARVPLEPLAQPVGEEADARQRRDREHQCNNEQRQLARAPVARGHAGGLADQVAQAEAACMRVHLKAGLPGRRLRRVLPPLQSRFPPIELSRDTMWFAMPRKPPETPRHRRGSAHADAAMKAAFAGRAEVRHYPCDHFDVWPGSDWFEPVLRHQVQFLERHLRVEDSPVDR